MSRLPGVISLVLLVGVSLLPGLPRLASVTSYFNAGCQAGCWPECLSSGRSYRCGGGREDGRGGTRVPREALHGVGSGRVRCVRENEGDLVMCCEIDESVCLHWQEPSEERCVEVLCPCCARGRRETLAARESNYFQMEIESHAALRVAEEQQSSVMRHAGKKNSGENPVKFAVFDRPEHTCPLRHLVTCGESKIPLNLVEIVGNVGM